MPWGTGCPVENSLVLWILRCWIFNSFAGGSGTVVETGSGGGALLCGLLWVIFSAFKFSLPSVPQSI